MKNNEYLQAICNALDLTADDLPALHNLCDHETPIGLNVSLLENCSNEQLRCVMEGLILQRRPPRADGKTPVINGKALSNNDILKKMRIALDLQHEDMLLIFEEGGAELTDSELGALFRKHGTRHFRECSDALLMQFLAGLNPSLDE